MPAPESHHVQNFTIDDRLARVLVTGAGGPAAVGFMRMVGLTACEWYAADIDRNAAGLYFVDRDHRILLRRGDDPTFVDHLLEVCHRLRIDVLVPTVDAELAVLGPQVTRFERLGIRVLMSPAAALATTLDKWALAERCATTVRVPATWLLNEATDLDGLTFPLIAKPRRGSGSAGIKMLTGSDDLGELPRDESYLLQEFLPGDEYSVDVLVRLDGQVVAAVPRRRDKVDSGVAVAGRTLHDMDLIDIATRVAQAVGVTGVANVQLRRAVDGQPALLEVNPRLPGTLSLTQAAGVDMARLALSDVLGLPVPKKVTFREVAVVRILTDVVVDIDDYQTVADLTEQTAQGAA